MQLDIFALELSFLKAAVWIYAIAVALIVGLFYPPFQHVAVAFELGRVSKGRLLNC